MNLFTSKTKSILMFFSSNRGRTIIMLVTLSLFILGAGAPAIGSGGGGG